MEVGNHPEDVGLDRRGLLRMEDAIHGSDTDTIRALYSPDLAVDVPLFWRREVSRHRLSILQLAITADSQAHQLLLVPLFARLTRAPGRLDGHGRGLRAFASFRPVDDFLAALGAPGPKRRLLGPLVSGRDDQHRFIPRPQWRRALHPDLTSFLEGFGFDDPDGRGVGRLHAHLSPRQAFVRAIRDRDRGRVEALIGLGGLDGPGDLLFNSQKTSDIGRVGPVGMAVVVDAEDDTVAWTTLLLEHVSPSQRDAHGRTPLHLVRSPAVCSLLIERGADLAARDMQGRLALDLVPDDCRALIERALIGQALSPASRQGEPARL